MQCYILHKSNLELMQIPMKDYIKIVLTGDKLYNDCIVLIFDPISGNVRSLDDVSKYWFHNFGGSLEENVHLSELDSQYYLDSIADFGSNMMALRDYKYSINRNVKHTLAEYTEFPAYETFQPANMNYRRI